jgi:hypothetical protein
MEHPEMAPGDEGPHRQPALAGLLRALVKLVAAECGEVVSVSECAVPLPLACATLCSSAAP